MTSSNRRRTARLFSRSRIRGKSRPSPRRCCCPHIDIDAGVVSCTCYATERYGCAYCDYCMKPKLNPEPNVGRRGRLSRGPALRRGAGVPARRGAPLPSTRGCDAEICGKCGGDCTWADVGGTVKKICYHSGSGKSLQACHDFIGLWTPKGQAPGRQTFRNANAARAGNPKHANCWNICQGTPFTDNCYEKCMKQGPFVPPAGLASPYQTGRPIPPRPERLGKLARRMLARRRGR